ncbi:hypothetical protein MLD38_011317 [Melastoma candidum]|uniref:Uncharacterized protein n=1 Tax=Melastoma candidum TaxID=119954 RepID=A0ACB9R662_9MYRT|nr:hypothetical protein MLD38_011317 [Melastoma candidum]
MKPGPQSRDVLHSQNTHRSSVVWELGYALNNVLKCHHHENSIKKIRSFERIYPYALIWFLTELRTENLPKLFVRPKKIVLDFQKGKAVGPVPFDFRSGEIQEENTDYVGELSVTLVDARKLSFYFYGKFYYFEKLTHIVLSLGDQVIRSKKNSLTTVIGPPVETFTRQDFHMLVANPRKQKLQIQVKDSLGFTDLTIGVAEADLGSLKDTVPTDRIVVLRGDWRVFQKGSSGEVLLRLTYKAYGEDEEDEKASFGADASDYESDSEDLNCAYAQDEKSSGTETESFMDVLAALIVSEEFQGIVASLNASSRFAEENSINGSKKASSDPNVGVPAVDSTNASEDLGGSMLLWLTVVTSIDVLIALNMDGSGFFNP